MISVLSINIPLCIYLENFVLLQNNIDFFSLFTEWLIQLDPITRFDQASCPNNNYDRMYKGPYKKCYFRQHILIYECIIALKFQCNMFKMFRQKSTVEVSFD